MPTKREREYYRMGFQDGQRFTTGRGMDSDFDERLLTDFRNAPVRKPKRKLSACQKYLKNKRNHIKYRDGKLNLKKMGVAFRRTRR